MLNATLPSPQYLATRRSCRPRDMVAPGPDAQTISDMVALALRTPDHGKLHPWRVVRVASNQREALAQHLEAAYRAEKPDAGRLEIEAMHTMAHHAPELLVVLYSPRESSKIPAWEQELSCGAFTMNLLHAVHAYGFVGGWITGWPAYSDAVRDLFGSAPERLAALLYIGTPKAALEERDRPECDAVLSEWQPPA